jgi:hypothetical protein
MSVRGVSGGSGGGGGGTPSIGPAASTIANADQFAFFQGGTYKSVTAQILAAYVASSIAGTYLSATTTAGNNNDFAPAGFSATVNRLDIDATAGAATLTGIANGTDNQILLISNIGANALILSNQDTNSLAINRFRSFDSFTLLTGASIYVTYFGGTVTRWVITP